jgi:hypothetical protein
MRLVSATWTPDSARRPGRSRHNRSAARQIRFESSRGQSDSLHAIVNGPRVAVKVIVSCSASD